jgi:hypothetical protein
LTGVSHHTRALPEHDPRIRLLEILDIGRLVFPLMLLDLVAIKFENEDANRR